MNSNNENLSSGSKRPADPRTTGNNKRPALVNITNGLNSRQEQEQDQEENVGLIYVMPEEKPLTPRPNLEAAGSTPSYMTAQESLSPAIDVELIDTEQQEQLLPATPRHAILFTLDKELNNEDPMQTWPYAMDVFVYQKQREKVFIIADYMASQVDLNPWKRRLLISWMVTVHQIYGTFRETLFLSVKIVDLYLSRHVVDESMLQLLGAAAFYIASKYEEKEVVPKEGLLEICHWEYTGRDLLQMEWQTLRGIGFDLGIPLGCRFLRRYARSSLVPEPTWTLASYILELALLEYSIVLHSDSQLAAAALFVALRMHGCTWNPALVHYSGYELRDFAGIVPKLNGVLHRSDCFTVKAVRSLYSTLLLHEVAKEPPLTNEQLFRHNPELYEGNVS